MRVPFFYSINEPANVNGDAGMMVGPDKVNEAWIVEQRIVKNTGDRIPHVFCYRNAVADTFFIDGTINGQFGTSETELDVSSSEVLIFEWSGCTPGSVCTVTLRGSRVLDV